MPFWTACERTSKRASSAGHRDRPGHRAQARPARGGQLSAGAPAGPRALGDDEPLPPLHESLSDRGWTPCIVWLMTLDPNRCSSSRPMAFRQQEKRMNFVKWSRVVLAGSLLAFGFANAADYPDHRSTHHRLGAGGGTDTVSRLTTPLAEKPWGSRSFSPTRPVRPARSQHSGRVGKATATPSCSRREPAALPGAGPVRAELRRLRPGDAVRTGLDGDRRA